MNRLPEDWNLYYSRCPRCKQLSHSSGTEVCACDQWAYDYHRSVCEKIEQFSKTKEFAHLSCHLNNFFTTFEDIEYRNPDDVENALSKLITELENYSSDETPELNELLDDLEHELADNAASMEP